MLATTRTFSLLGIEVREVHVEVDVCQRGLQTFSLVGLPDAAVRESRERVRSALENSGFDVAVLETGPFREQPKPELAWVEHLLERYILSRELRGDGIYAVGRKTSPVRERYPAWLYQ